jgi:hypothetical protein
MNYEPYNDKKYPRSTEQIRDLLLAIAIGVGLALALVAWWAA